MKKTIKLSILFLCFILFAFIPNTYVNAAVGDELISPLLSTINSTTAFLTLSNKQATATTKVITKKTCDITITMKLQKKSGSSWTTIKTWKETKKNTALFSLVKTYTVSSGTYRVYSSVTAGNESNTAISDVKTH